MPSLTVCMIVRDAEAHLASALQSVADVAEELIVLDTGSADNTPQIAAQAGARVERFVWIDDFSAARNHCFTFARGDWILWLDSDEVLLPGSEAELARCMDDAGASAYLIQRQDLRDVRKPDAFTIIWQLRLIRRADHPPFVGRIHEHFDPQLPNVSPSTIKLRHIGSVTTVMPEKDERNARLLAMELQERPGQFYYLVELGRTLLSAKDPGWLDPLREAAEIAMDPAKTSETADAPMALLLECVLALPNLPNDFPMSRDHARRIVKQHFLHSAPLLWHVAQQEFKAGNFGECAALLERIIHLGETETYDMHVSFDPRIIRDDAWLNLGVCYTRLARLEDAAKCFERLLSSKSRANEANRNLQQVRALLGR